MNISVPFRGAGARRHPWWPVGGLLLLALAWGLGRPVTLAAADRALAAPAPPAGVGKPAPGARPEAGRSGLRVELVKSAPSEGTLRVGGAASFEAKLLDGGREIGADGYLCRWRSDAGARFLEAEGPARNTAVFLRPGRQRVWLEVTPRSGASHGLAAVSEAVELEVGEPSFTLTVTPPAPLVGEEVTVAIRDFPLHDGVEFRWDPLPAKAKLSGVTERGLTFYLTEAGAVPVKVAASLGNGGPDLGGAKVTVTAKPYSVAVDNRGLAEPAAVIWREGEGPVAAEGVAVGQKVRLRAAVTPSPRHPPLGYDWEVCPGARFTAGETGREILAVRQEVGPCPVTVTVRDGRGIVLGRGQGLLEVAVPREALEAAEANARETERLVADAGRAWKEGRIDRAEELADQAAGLNPASQEAVANRERLRRDKARLDTLLAKARQALAGDDFTEVAAMLEAAAKVNPRAGAVGEVARESAARQEVLARIARLLAEARDKWEAGEVEAGLALTGRALELDPGHGLARAERERMVTGRDRLIAALKQSAAHLAAKRFDSAASALAEARAVNPRFAAIAEMEQAIASRKDRAWRLDERLARARDQWNAGDADGALGTLVEAGALDPEHAGAAAARKSLAEARDQLAKAEDRAEAALARGELDAARTALDEAGRLCPRHPRLAELARVAAERAGRDKRLAGLRAEANRRLAAGDLDGAVTALEAMLALAPADKGLAAERDRLARSRDTSSGALRRAADYLAERRYDLALSALAEAEKASARPPALAALRERVLAEKGKAEQAAAHQLAEARARLDKKDYPGARAALDAARAAGALPPALARQAQEAGRRLDEALARQEAARREQAARTAPARTAGLAEADRRARCEAVGREAAALRAGGDHAGAIRHYQTLLELCPDTCPAYNNVGASLFSLGYLSEAVPWFDEAVKCAPNEKLFGDNAAMVRARLAEAARPAADAAQACADAFAVAESARDAGRLEEAMTGYRTVLARCPDFCAAYNNMGLALHKLGRPAESLPLFEQALRCNPKENLFRDNYDLTARRLRAAATPP